MYTERGEVRASVCARQSVRSFRCDRFTLFAIVVFSASLAVADAAPATTKFNIEAQEARKALTLFARQARVQLGYAADVVDDILTNQVNGEYENAQALALLLEGTGLEALYGESGITIRRVPEREVGGDIEERTPPVAQTNSLRFAQASAAEVHATVAQKLYEEEEPADKEERRRSRDEIVVVGTQIPGIANATSPIQVFDRDAIEKSGFATTQQFIQSLPVNFNGGFSDSTLGAITGGGDVTNRSEGTGINLRGLGNDSTLVLVNGQRIVSGNEGDSVDLSLIPASAIERMEILTDGASALYGADAVGGVINVRLRDNFDGAETRLRHGRATQGGLEEYRVGQTVGKTWTSGSALAYFEWFSRGDLRAIDRSFSDTSAEQLDLVASQRRKSVFINATQALNEKTEISGFATYATRHSLKDTGFVFGDPSNPSVEKRFHNVEQYNASLAVKHDLTNSWSTTLSGGYGVTDTRVTRFRGVMPPDTPFDELLRKPELAVAELKAGGDVFSVPGGIVKLAIGTQFRRDKLSSVSSALGLTSTLDRNVAAVFGEAYLPLVSGQNRIPGVNSFEVTAAGRFEHFNDFGSKTTPKFGAVWSPAEGMNIRATWGKSFRAPLLTELDDSDRFTAGLFEPDPTSPTGVSGLAIILNSNPNLAAENATIWTIGIDTSDFVIPGLAIEATYFDIAFKNRIATPTSAVPLNDAFLREDDLGSLLTRMLDPSFKAELFSNFDFNLLPSADDIDALYDARLHNLAETNESGVDLTVSYATSSAVGDFSFNFSGTYIRNFESRLFVTTPFISQVNTLFNPVDLRFRTGASWSRSGVTLSGYVNYVDDYANVSFSPAEPVESFTTVDLTASLDFGAFAPSSNSLRDLTLQVSATNLFNEDPPFVQIPSTFVSVFFDGANANPFGRVVAIELVKGFHF